MPPGTPYNSFILPYRIRVDDFGQSTTQDCAAALHLLSHTHSDHVNGLSAQSFGYTVICSKDAKEMLLRHEVYAERELHELDLRAEKTRTYSHLKVDPRMQPDGTTYYAGSRDLLKAVPLDTPIQQELSDGEFVTITLLNANHCPGSVMFLIEGAQGAILHTGDFRAEPWFLDSLTRHPSLQPYLALHNPFQPSCESNKSHSPVVKTLEAIYLDTASVLSKISVPSKERATTGLIELMKLFPETAYFFINIWTWGYEDILKAIARAFRSQVHVDRYKFSIFQSVSDPFLQAITTRNSSSTRFHACERFHRCEYVAVDNEPGESYSNVTSHMGKRVVYVNPVTMGSVSWSLYIQDTKDRLLSGEVINNLLVPLSRHSPLPELRDFVALFRPWRVVPNTLDPRLQGLDWRAINNMFEDCLHPRVPSSRQPNDTLDLPHLQQLVQDMEGDMDIALKNLVGDGAAGLAERWAENGKLRQKLEVVRMSLGAVENNILNCLLGIQPSPPNEEGDEMLGKSTSREVKGKGKEQPDISPVDSEDESDNGFSEDERGKTAHRLFAGLAGIEESEYAWWVSPPASQKSDTWVLDGLKADKLQSFKDSAAPPGETGTAPSWAARLTPVPSPVRRPVSERKGSPLQISLLPGKRRRHSDAKSPSGTHLRKRLLVGDPTTSSPVLSTSHQTCSHGPVVIKRSEHFTASPIASSSRLSVSASAQHDPPPCPLLELNNYHPKGTLHPVPQHDDDGISKGSKLPVSDPEQSISQSPVGDENRAAGEVSLLPHAVRESRRRFGPHRRLLSIPTSPNRQISRVKDEDPKVSDRRARRSKFHAQRLSIAARLAQARPDLVTPTYESKREALLGREARAQERLHSRKCERQKDKMKAHLAATGTLLSIGTVDEDDGGMDWDRSRVLAEAIKADIADGRRPMLPPLVCAESP